MRLSPAILLALTVAACSRPPAGPPRDAAAPRGDSVEVPVAVPPAPDLVAAGVLALSGGATYDTVTVGQAGVLRAETEPQLAAARRLVESGVYLADPYRTLRLLPSEGTDAIAALGRELAVGTPISVELIIRAAGPAPAPLLRFEHVAEEDGGGRRMPSAVAMELLPAAGGGYDRARLLLGSGGDWSEQEAVALPSLDWEQYAHRIGIVLARDVVSLAVDGNAVIEQRVRVHGGVAAPRLRAIAGAPGASVTVLQMTGLVEDRYIGAESNAGERDRPADDGRADSDDGDDRRD